MSRPIASVPVSIDTDIHSREPESEIERITWETLDTAWKALREGAVRITIQAMRDSYAEAGVDFPATDEELFEKGKESGDPAAPDTYLDLAPESPLAATMLSSAFTLLEDQALSEAQEGIDMSQGFAAELDKLTGE